MAKNPEFEKFAAVVLAAGSSSRLGQPKQLVKIEGETLVRRTCRQLLNLRPLSLTVVTGFSSASVREELSDLEVKVVRNDDWAQGMGSSIACGVQDVPEQAKGLLMTVCDLWKIGEPDLIDLLTAWSSNISVITATSWYDDKAFIYGPPVLFPRNMIRELKKLTGNQGAKALIAQNMSGVRFVEMENAAFDLDTAGDLEQLFKRTGPNPSS
jgi:molybdenum cofactor cytidylyltransferase